LQALNEELRSSAEELETSKEELQSVNEELTTVNQELRIKIEELAVANNDLLNLINSSDVGTIFLDRELRVKMSTPSARDVFNLHLSDSGRLLSDITSRLRYDELHDDVRLVLQDLQGIDREVQGDDRWYLMRIRPYRTTDNRIDGVVLTFQDITSRRRAELQLRQSEERLRLLIDSVVDYAIFTVSEDGTVDSWNPGAQRIFGYTAEETLGRTLDVLFTPEDRAAGIPAAELDRAKRNGRAADERAHMRKDGSIFYCSESTFRIGEDARLGYVKVARDLSVSRSAAEALEHARRELQASVQAAAAAAGEARLQERTSSAQFAGLLRKVVTAQEDERARIARDLHDQFGQQLTALRLTLEQLRDRFAAAGTDAQDVDRALALARQIDSGVDFLAWELRPAALDDLGLAAALPRFVREWSSHSGIPAEYRGHGVSAGVVGTDAELVFYRVAQEALTNVMKHAHASRVDVLLEARDGWVVLVVEDDGLGFDASERPPLDTGLGLVGMRERAATIGADLEIETAPGEGTAIYLRCPAASRRPVKEAE
jgi:two-component system CheB/CheR fusion protein